MRGEEIHELLELVQQGACSVAEAEGRLKGLESKGNLDYLWLDHHRQARIGQPEVIMAENKSAEQLVAILTVMLEGAGVVMATRVDVDKGAAVVAALPEVSYHPRARMLVARMPSEGELLGRGVIRIVCAGTSDIPVAREAAVTARCLGNKVEAFHDIGVAGIHRLYARLDLLQDSEVIIVVAGMEGALPSVVAGLVAPPVIAVPVSVGYGSGQGGIAALLGMLNSCAQGLAVVNIDNGFGAACMASAINRQGHGI